MALTLVPASMAAGLLAFPILVHADGGSGPVMPPAAAIAIYAAQIAAIGGLMTGLLQAMK